MIEDEKGLLGWQDVGFWCGKTVAQVRCQILKTRFWMYSFDLGNSKTKTVKTKTANTWR